jgi:hypothetical protein
MDDLVGCDTLLTGGFTYNNGTDPIYGNNPPCFFTKSLAGPVTYIPGETFIDNNGNGSYDEGIDTPLDTAFVHRGQILGIRKYPGAKNQTLSSFIHYMNGEPNVRDPNNKEEARNYMLGLTLVGNLVDPCTWSYGEVRGGVNCSQVNPLFWYSGDPVTDIGWINNYPTDQRQLTNIGPFKLDHGKEVEIIVAYVIGQSNDALSSITEARYNSIQSQGLHDFNFLPDALPVWMEEIAQDYIPKEYTLYQNYPNPFNPSTKISWQLPVGSHQTLKIYDVLGNEVATLVDEYRPAGTYEVEFNISSISGFVTAKSGYASGIYFYRLRTNEFIQTKKMLLLK